MGPQPVNVHLVRFYPAVGREAVAAAAQLHLRVKDGVPAALAIDMRADENPASPGATLLMELNYTTAEGKYRTLWKGSKQIVAVDLSTVTPENESRYKKIAAKKTNELFNELVDAVLRARAQVKAKQPVPGT